MAKKQTDIVVKKSSKTASKAKAKKKAPEDIPIPPPMPGFMGMPPLPAGAPADTMDPPSLPMAGTKTQMLLQELLRLAILSFSVCLLLALVSYAPSDPSWSTWSSKGNVLNWMGRAGSISSDLLLQFLGLAAFPIAFLIAGLGLKRRDLFDESSQILRVYIAPPLFLLSLSILLQAVYPVGWMPWGLESPGGLAGYICLTGFQYALGKVGAILVSSILVFASAILLSQYLLLSSLSERLPSIFWGSGLFIQALFGKLKSMIFRSKEVPNEMSFPMGVEPTLNPETAPVMPPPNSEFEPEVEEKKGIFNKVAGGLLKRKKKNADTQLQQTKWAKSNPQSPYQLPTIDLLNDNPEITNATNQEWYIEKGRILVEKLNDFGVEGEIVNICPGPVITVYEFKPASGVKIKEIANLSDDLTLAMSALSVRIVAPIPGKPVVGIEIPSEPRQMVFFKSLLQETPFFGPEKKIPLLLGRLASGEPIAADLAKMPHLLVAGATGTGKSVFINTLISSLVYRFTPDQMRLILVDPKMVELANYDAIPHLLLPVVVESKKAVFALRWAVEEMERRYVAMHKMGVRHLDTYNEKVRALKAEEAMTGLSTKKEEPEEGMPSEDEEEKLETLPYVVIVIDEYADLMAVVPKDVEMCITRLAQKARASGIHLVLATQRPSTDVVTGTIKANFPSRISFRVASNVDSKTILDRPGAERLLGQGDLLFYSAGFTSLKRMQGAYITDEEIERMVAHLKMQGEPNYDEAILERAEQNVDEGRSPMEQEKENKLYDEAVALVTSKGEASISLIQRHLRIGYNKAAMLMEEMENQGIVAPATGASKRRAVLVGQI